MDYIVPFETIEWKSLIEKETEFNAPWPYLCLSVDVSGGASSSYGLQLWVNGRMIGKFDSTEFFGDPYNPMGFNQ
jgi:hypothetical protein